MAKWWARGDPKLPPLEHWRPMTNARGFSVTDKDPLELLFETMLFNQSHSVLLASVCCGIQIITFLDLVLIAYVEPWLPALIVSFLCDV